MIDPSANGGGSNSGSGSANGGANAQSKLTLDPRVKSVLSTKLMLSDEDIAQICEEAGQEN